MSKKTDFNFNFLKLKLTVSVIIGIIFIIGTVLDVKLKHYKWKLLKLSTTATVRRCSSKKVFFKVYPYSQENNCVGASLKSGSETGVFLLMLRIF